MYRDNTKLKNKIYIYNTFIYPMIEKGEYDKIYRTTKRAKVLL